MTQPCSKEGFLGQVAEFMEDMKGLKGILFTVAFAIVIQVITFAFLWGGLTTTVKSHDKNIENNDMEIKTQAKNIDRILGKLENINIVGFAYAKGDKGEKGDIGLQGIAGKDGK